MDGYRWRIAWGRWLFRQIAARGCAVVMSTHNTALIENYPARAILFAQGKIREVNLEEELG